MNQDLPEIKIELLFSDLQTSFISYLHAHLHLGHFQISFLN